MRWTENTLIEYKKPNPKSGKSFFRYGGYMHAKTVGQALAQGSYGLDLLFDFETGLLKCVGGPKRAKPPAHLGVPKEVFAKYSKTDKVLAKMYERNVKWTETFHALDEAGLNRKDLKAANDEDDGCGKDSIQVQIGRRKAQERAKQVLKLVKKEGDRPVSDAELLSCLKLWGFKENTNRSNVTPDGEAFVYSDTIGLIKQSVCERTLLTVGTRRYAEFTQLISKWLSARLPDALQGKFGFTSVNINKNYAGKLHRDGNNAGPSLIKAFGDFIGGELNYWPSDDKKTPLEDFDHSKKVTVNIKDNLLLFDGNRGHYVNNFHGERYTLVFFSVRTWNKVPKDIVNDAIRCGVPVPTEGVMKHAQKLLGPSGKSGYRTWRMSDTGESVKAGSASPALETPPKSRARPRGSAPGGRGSLRAKGVSKSCEAASETPAPQGAGSGKRRAATGQEDVTPKAKARKTSVTPAAGRGAVHAK